MNVQDRLDACLIDLKRGKATALKEIYDLISHSVFGVAISVTKNYALSEEIMQDTFIKLQEKINYYKEGTNAHAFIITIARNLALNELKKNNRVVSADFLEETLQDNNKIEMTTVLKIALNTLNELERQVVLLNVVSGFKHREIAVILNKPLGTVLWIYSKAMAKLKSDLKEV